MEIREATDEDSPTVLNEFIAPLYRDAEERDPAYSELDEEGLGNLSCGR